MADVLNLNRARKAKARDAAKSRASENRAAFGRTKEECELEKARAQKAARDLDAKKRE